MNREVYSRTEKTSDCWETPKYFFDLLDEEFHFTLDPCASHLNHKCKKYYTIDDDGLKQDWSGEVAFVNPPFGNIAEWVKKCYEESEKNRDFTKSDKNLIVMIIPSRTDTRYWHEYIMKARGIRFCKGRVNFLLNGQKPKNGSTFPLAVVIFKGSEFNYPPMKISTYYHKENNLREMRDEKS